MVCLQVNIFPPQIFQLVALYGRSAQFCAHPPSFLRQNCQNGRNEAPQPPAMKIKISADSLMLFLLLFCLIYTNSNSNKSNRFEMDGRYFLSLGEGA